MTEGRTRDEDNKERDKCGDTVPAGKCISAGKVSGVEYTTHAAYSCGVHSSICTADRYAISRTEKYPVEWDQKMSERMRESVLFPGGNGHVGGCADTHAGSCDRCQGMDVEELGSVHTHGGGCTGGHILGWNNKNICVIQAARYQMESDRYTVRLDSGGTSDSPWQADKSGIR